MPQLSSFIIKKQAQKKSIIRREFSLVLRIIVVIFDYRFIIKHTLLSTFKLAPEACRRLILRVTCKNVHTLQHSCRFSFTHLPKNAHQYQLLDICVHKHTFVGEYLRP